MEKKFQMIEKITYILDEQDVKIIKELLNYCWHRAAHHTTPICSLREEIIRLRKEFSIIK